MAEDHLFEIKEENLESGLRGVPVGYCITSQVDPYKGLFYREFPVTDFVNKSPEETIYFMLYQAFPSNDELDGFIKQLVKRATLSSELIRFIDSIPSYTDPMRMFVLAILGIGMDEKNNDYREDTLKVIAQLPEVAARVINHHAGQKTIEVSDFKLGYVENFVHMLHLPNLKDKRMFIEVLKLFHIVSMDHGGGNLSTFVGKAVASGHADLFFSLASAMSALAGPLHGKANQDAYYLIKEFQDKLKGDVSDEKIEALIRLRLKEKGLMYGFGHGVLRVEDPRATIFYQFANEHFKDCELVKIALGLRKMGVKVLKENPKIQSPYPNCDSMSGVLFSCSGFDNPLYFTVLFGLSRCIGISRQIIYERYEARGSKGVPITRPKYIYKPNQ